MDLPAKLSFCCALAVLLAACASGPESQPPNTALADAQTAIAQAEQADAGRYAPVALDNARNKLTDAEQLLGPERDNEDHFLEARRLAEEAAADAQLARAQALARQAQMNAEAAEERASGTPAGSQLEPQPQPLTPPGGAS
ncbi:MAG TPA: DUF4398 domain-containing protein [Gammaproteobacteria bacterium]|nr:DUF4398 domain-containing protein [Gammaproteobacteria bacterium]